MQELRASVQIITKESINCHDSGIPGEISGDAIFNFMGNYSALFLYNIGKNVEKNMFFGIKKDYH